MAGQKPKRPLPAGVVPVRQPFDEDDPASRVREKAPPRESDAPPWPGAAESRGLADRLEDAAQKTPQDKASLLVDESIQIAVLIKSLLEIVRHAGK